MHATCKLKNKTLNHICLSFLGFKLCMISINWSPFDKKQTIYVSTCYTIVKGEPSPKIDFSSLEYLGIVEQLYEVFLCC